jgi:hypothetical protein
VSVTGVVVMVVMGVVVVMSGSDRCCTSDAWSGVVLVMRGSDGRCSDGSDGCCCSDVW